MPVLASALLSGMNITGWWHLSPAAAFLFARGGSSRSPMPTTPPAPAGRLRQRAVRASGLTMSAGALC